MSPFDGPALPECVVRAVGRTACWTRYCEGLCMNSSTTARRFPLAASLPRCLAISLPFSLCAAHAVIMRMASSTVCAQVKDVSGSGNNWAQGHIEYGEREHRGERAA